MNDASFYIDKMLNHYGIFTISELAETINVQQPVISGWRGRNSITPIKKKCRELGIYNEIFGDAGFNVQIKKEPTIKPINQTDNSDIEKYFKALKSVAEATNKEAELIQDIKNLMQKYIR